MRLPWRRATGRHAAVPVPRVATRRPPAVGPDVVPAEVAPAAPAVCLGFADGSDVSLPPEDPTATALRAVADLLVKTRPVPPTTNGTDHAGGRAQRRPQ